MQLINNPPEQLQQTPHIVAHLDFIGARNKMRSQEARNNFLQQIYEIYTTTDSRLSMMTKRIRESLYYRIFSDNILVAAEIDKHGSNMACFVRIARFCTLFQFLALTKGLFVRGAIAYGDFVGNDTFVFGEALVNAYEAETDRAIYPRVIIDSSVFNTIVAPRFHNAMRHESIKGLFNLDFDGLWYISPFGVFPPNQCNAELNRKHLEETQNNILQEYQNSQKENHKQKYYWLINKFNEFCQNNPQYQDLQILPSDYIDYATRGKQ